MLQQLLRGVCNTSRDVHESPTTIVMAPARPCVGGQPLAAVRVLLHTDVPQTMFTTQTPVLRCMPAGSLRYSRLGPFPLHHSFLC